MICSSTIGVWKRATAELPSDVPRNGEHGNARFVTPLADRAGEIAPEARMPSMNLRRR
jgi:hypothetical protein